MIKIICKYDNNDIFIAIPLKWGQRLSGLRNKKKINNIFWFFVQISKMIAKIIQQQLDRGLVINSGLLSTNYHGFNDKYDTNLKIFISINQVRIRVKKINFVFST